MASVHVGLFLLLLCWKGSAALQWLNQPQGPVRIQACKGSNITFPWVFTLAPNETVEDIKWLYTPSAGTPDLLANYVYGHFIPVGSYVDRVSHLGNGSIELNQVTDKDSGHYEIEVAIRQGNQFLTIRQTAVLEVTVGPSHEQLMAYETGQAVYDPATNQHHMMLACGRLSFVGQPPVTVVWTLPSGAEVGSSYSKSGTYFLSVPNPVQGGNYSCRVGLPSSGPACQSGNASAVPGSVQVDGILARLVLLEAKGEALVAENGKLRAELNETRTNLTNENNQLKTQLAHTQTQLTSGTQQLTSQLQNTNGSFEKINNQLKLELRLTEDLLNDLKVEMAALQNHVNTSFDTLHSRLDSLHSCQDSQHVSFHARMTPLHDHTNHQLQFDDVVTNEGNGYNAHTGQFRAPFNGTYFFAFTTTPKSLHHIANCQLTVDGRDVASIKTKYTDDYFNMATGHAALRLHKGQTVAVMVEPRVGVRLGIESFESELSFFTGFLVSADC